MAEFVDFTFDLTAEMRARLRGLAEHCRTTGRGRLATANYHGQGAVQVPAQWLLEILGPEVDQFVVNDEREAYESGLGWGQNQPCFYQQAVERCAEMNRDFPNDFRVDEFIPW